MLTKLGSYGKGVTLEKALERWAGCENLEERLLPGRIDPIVLEHMRSLAK